MVSLLSSAAPSIALPFRWRVPPPFLRDGGVIGDGRLPAGAASSASFFFAVRVCALGGCLRISSARVSSNVFTSARRPMLPRFP